MDISIRQAMTVIEDSFKPLECKAEDYDYNSKLRFIVISDGERVYEEKRLLEEQCSSFSSLNAYIENTRKILVERGFQLEEWNFPELPKNEIT